MSTVWTSAWEWQCCEGPFTVGSSVTWNLDPSVDSQWLTPVLGDEEAAKITHQETHHGPEPEDRTTIPTHGVVKSIRAVFCRYAPRPDQDQTVRYPVPGTSIVEPRDSADGRDDREDDELRLCGYIVELEPVS
jgi:hypothetical protein